VDESGKAGDEILLEMTNDEF